MSEQLKESLSAALDNEADEFELRRVLDETARDDTLRETFERYQLIQSTLRGEASARTLAGRQLLQRRLRQALDVDLAHPDPDAADAVMPAARPVSGASGWPRTASLMVAVIAAVGVYFGAGSLLHTPDEQPPVPIGTPDFGRVLPTPATPVTSEVRDRAAAIAETVPQWSDQSPEIRERHARWMAFHTRASDTSRSAVDQPNGVAESVTKGVTKGVTKDVSEVNWQPVWIPAGFERVPIDIDDYPDIIAAARYSDAVSSFTVIVSPSVPPAIQPSESMLEGHWIGERVGAATTDSTATTPLIVLVGDLPPPVARRVMGSVAENRQPDA